MRLLLFAFLMCFTALPVWAQERGVPFVWQVEVDFPFYFVGSIHVLHPDDHPLPKGYDSLINEVDQVVLEVDSDEMTAMGAELIKLIKQHAVIKGQGRIDDVLTKEAVTVYHRQMQQSGLMPKSYERFKPWYGQMLMANVLFSQLKFDPNLGVDLHVLRRAKEKQRTIVQLEEVSEIFSLLGSVTYFEESVCLESLDRWRRENAKEDKIFAALEVKMAENLVRTWRKGSLKTIEEHLAILAQACPAQYRVMLSERNRRWLPQVQSFIDARTPTLVVAGLAHFAGTDSLLSLLRDKGYRVKPIRYVGE